MTRLQQAAMQTRALPVDASKIGAVAAVSMPGDLLDELHVDLNLESVDTQNLKFAADKLKSSSIPVAFPTETVYGLGADATRSDAVNGIYKAKQRPSDNPLIVHFASLKQLRSLLRGYDSTQPDRGHHQDCETDPIPAIYRPLISRFWPGPLTIILPNPLDSPLAPEVTAGLNTFGARMPRHILALVLIQLANVPVAAPSANASTKPSPTAAEHVVHDLDGRIETIIDGGPCDVGVESTVVDGLSTPPLILRPGGISLEQIRSCPGWESVQNGYRNVSEKGTQPKAPGMKYRHYSPKAVVVLFEAGKEPPSQADLWQQVGTKGKIGIIRTKLWKLDASQAYATLFQDRGVTHLENGKLHEANSIIDHSGFKGMLKSMQAIDKAKPALCTYEVVFEGSELKLLDIDLGPDTAGIARGIFSALRDLDREEVDTIFVEGIDDNEGDTAAAIMNRLRKAAEIRVN